MFKFIKNTIYLGVITTLFASTSYAAKASDITIKGDTIKPATTMLIPLDQLIEYVPYDLNCTLVNNNNTNVTVVVITQGMMPQPLEWDGQMMSTQKKDATPGTHILKIRGVMKSETAKVSLINADQTNSIDLDSCLATA